MELRGAWCVGHKGIPELIEVELTSGGYWPMNEIMYMGFKKETVW